MQVPESDANSMLDRPHDCAMRELGPDQREWWLTGSGWWWTRRSPDHDWYPWQGERWASCAPCNSRQIDEEEEWRPRVHACREVREWHLYQRPMTEDEFQEADSADLLAALQSAWTMGIPMETDEQRMVWFGFYFEGLSQGTIERD